MQVVTVSAKDTLSILFVGDLHLGDEGSYFNNVMQYLKETSDYIVFLGDVIDAGIRDSFNPHNQVPSVNSQIVILLEELKALAGRVVLFVAGNHEERLNKKAGVKIEDIIQTTLDIPTTSDFGIIDVTVPGNVGSRKRICYRVACAHGVAGGRFPEKSVRQGRYFTDMIQNIDLFVLGHTHQASLYFKDVYFYDDKNKSVLIKQILIANIGGLTDAEYGRKALYNPTSPMLFRAVFHANVRKISTEFVQI